MPVIRRATAPVFELPHASFTGLASPSRGAAETSVWQVTLPPGAPAVAHSLDREEVLVILSGHATATIDGQTVDVAPGDALIVPAHRLFSLANPHDQPLSAIAVLPVGGRATMAGGEPFTPPWAT